MGVASSKLTKLIGDSARPAHPKNGRSSVRSGLGFHPDKIASCDDNYLIVNPHDG